MQKNPTLRLGQTAPLLSELLARRGQTLSEFMNELDLQTERDLEVHCITNLINRDLTPMLKESPAVLAIPPKLPKVAPKKEEKSTESKKEEKTQVIETLAPASLDVLPVPSGSAKTS